MAKLKLYVDTSVFGAVCDPTPEERLRATRLFLDALAGRRFDGYISTLVVEEIERAPERVRAKIGMELSSGVLTVLEETAESLSLASMYVSAGAIPATYEDDARHVAVAAVNNIAVIVSWNFRHMVNVERKRRINGVNLREGFPLIDLVSPWEVPDE